MAETSHYNNYFVAPLLDTNHPDWLRPVEMPATRLTGSTVASIACSLALQLPQAPEPTLWQSRSRELIRNRSRGGMS